MIGAGRRECPAFKSDRGDFFFFRDAEGRAAAAGRDHVGVVDLEAGALHGLDVVDDRALDVGQRGAVHKDPQAVVGEDLVAGALLVEGERVLEARAAATAHADAQTGRLDVRALGGEELLDLLCALLGERDHVSYSRGVPANTSRSVAVATLSVRCPQPTSSSSASRPRSPARKPT